MHFFYCAPIYTVMHITGLRELFSNKAPGPFFLVLFFISYTDIIMANSYLYFSFCLIYVKELFSFECICFL